MGQRSAPVPGRQFPGEPVTGTVPLVPPEEIQRRWVKTMGPGGEVPSCASVLSPEDTPTSVLEV